MSDAAERTALRARWVVPVTAAAISNGVVVIDGRRIVEVRPAVPGESATDLGDVALLPGLVNAHTHLEFSNLDRPLGQPGMRLVDWLAEVVRLRRAEPQDHRRHIQRGIEESIRHGVCTIGEIAQADWPAAVFARAALSTVAFLELIGPTPARVPDAIQAAENHLQGPPPGPNVHLGLSPHAPYSVHPQLLDSAVARSVEHRLPLAMHLAESPEEIELLRDAAGGFRDLLERLEAWDPALHCPGRRPLDYLGQLARAHRSLVIHGNYLDDEEIDFLAEHRRRMSVVYCPRTHAHFRHAPYPLEKLLAAGATVALGTDSRASSPNLSILEEMQAAHRRHPTVSPAAIIETATLGGARALGLDDSLGSLQPGKLAHLTAISLPRREAADPHAPLLAPDARVISCWLAGGPARRCNT